METSGKEKMNLVELSRTNLPRAVILLAWPIIIEMLLQSAVGIADTAMVGRLGPASIAAVGLGNQVIMLFLTIFAAVRTGTTVLVARLVGAGDAKKAEDGARQSIVVTIIFGILIALFGLLFPEFGYKLLGAGPDVIEVGVGYMHYRSIAALFAMITMIVTAILRGAGDTMTAMQVNVIMNVINIIFNYLLIFGKFGFPNMGTAGAGAATMLARIIGAFLMLRVLYLGVGTLRVRHFSLRLDRDTMRRLFNVGFPAGIEQALMRGAQVFFTMIITGLGTATYAAHQIILRVDSVAFMPGFGFATAATTLVGQNLGGNQPDEAEKAANMTMRIAILFMSAIGVLMFFFARPILFVFTDNTEVIEQGLLPLRSIAFAMPFMAVARVAAGALRGAGDVKYVMWGTGISIWVARLGVTYILVRILNWDLIGAWMGMFSDHVLRAVLFYVRYRKNHWKEFEI